MPTREKWERVLLALYAEALSCGSFAEVTAKTMGMESGEFGWTLYALQMRGLIEGCRFQPPQPDSPGALMGVLRNALIKELRTHYKQCRYQDASFREYGYGATMVTIP